jgi:hypothetical protein
MYNYYSCLDLALFLIIIQIMNITVHTPEGTYIVPNEKYPLFIAWLNANAVKSMPSQPIREVQQPFDVNNQPVLLNE